MQKLTYVPPGESIERPDQCAVFSLSPPYILGTVSGVGGAETSLVQDTVPGVDGSYVYTTRTESREVNATIHVQGVTRQGMYEKRFGLIRKLSPRKEPGTLYYQNDYISVRIAAYPANAAEFAARILNWNTAQLTFRCPFPFWESVEESPPAYMAYLDSGLEWPMEFAPEDDRLIEFSALANRCSVENSGSVETPVCLTISGPAENPAVLNLTSGEIIRVKKTLKEGETLIIYTKPGEKSVTLVDTDGVRSNAFAYIDLQSTFFQLQPGINELQYESGNNSEQTKVIIQFREQYAGV